MHSHAGIHATDYLDSPPVSSKRKMDSTRTSLQFDSEKMIIRVQFRPWGTRNTQLQAHQVLHDSTHHFPVAGVQHSVVFEPLSKRMSALDCGMITGCQPTGCYSQLLAGIINQISRAEHVSHNYIISFASLRFGFAIIYLTTPSPHLAKLPVPG